MCGVRAAQRAVRTGEVNDEVDVGGEKREATQATARAVA